jgi:hypothetical protein
MHIAEELLNSFDDQLLCEVWQSSITLILSTKIGNGLNLRDQQVVKEFFDTERLQQ